MKPLNIEHLFNEENFRLIIDNIVDAMNSEDEFFDAEDVMHEIARTIGSYAFENLINYDAVLAIVDGKIAEIEEQGQF